MSGHSITHALSSAGKTVSKPFVDAGKGIADAGKAVGDWTAGAAKTVGTVFTGTHTQSIQNLP